MCRRHDDFDSDAWYLESVKGQGFAFFRSSLSSAAGGLLIMIDNTYLALFESYSSFDIVPGRVLAVEMKSNGANVTVINVHVHGHNNDEASKLEIMRLLLNFIQQRRNHTVFLLGDWNFILSNDDRINLSTGELCDGNAR